MGILLMLSPDSVLVAPLEGPTRSQWLAVCPREICAGVSVVAGHMERTWVESWQLHHSTGILHAPSCHMTIQIWHRALHMLIQDVFIPLSSGAGDACSEHRPDL